MLFSLILSVIWNALKVLFLLVWPLIKWLLIITAIVSGIAIIKSLIKNAK